MSRPAILITAADLAPQALALLADYEIVYAGKTPTEDDIVALCRQHNPVAIIVRYSKVGAAAMDAAPALKVISKHGSGTDTIDKVAAKMRGIEVVAAVGANAAAVAEQALALLLACAKSVPQLNERMHAGHWDKATHKSLELGGRTIGLIGLGAIGLRFAKMAHALDMRVLGYDPFAKNLPEYVQPADLETLWRESDAVSLHCPLTDDNRHLLNADTLARCKPGVIVVNTGRAPPPARGLDRRGGAARRRAQRPGAHGRAGQLCRGAVRGPAPVPAPAGLHPQPAHWRRDQRRLREHGAGRGAQRTGGAGPHGRRHGGLK